MKKINNIIINASIVILTILSIDGCGKDLYISGHTVGIVKISRPQVTIKYYGKTSEVFEDTRILPESEVETYAKSKAILIMDSGVLITLDENTLIKVVSAEEIEVKSGRIFVRSDMKEKLTVRCNGSSFIIASNSASIALEKDKIYAYSFSGELTYNSKWGSGMVRAGESIKIGPGSTEIKPEELWNDWTGGMASAGPKPMETLTGIGQIFARIPGSRGIMRTPLIIRRHEVRITIKGDLAVTETMQEFFNPASETMEGIFKLRIPQDAVLQRFAVDRNGKLIDGQIMERREAGKEYKSHVYKGSTSDPALLEWIAPGNFKAQIYPIKPGQTRIVVYTYSQWLIPSGKDGKMRTYIYPVGNETIPPKIGEFYLIADVRDAGSEIIQAGSGAKIEKGRVIFSQSDFRPRSDFYIQILNVQSELKDDEVLMVSADYTNMLGMLRGKESEKYGRIQLPLKDETIKFSPLKNLKLSIVIDVSAGTDQQMVDLGTSFLGALLKQLKEDDEIAVFTGDIDTRRVLKEGTRAVKVTEEIKEKILQEVGKSQIGGASDIGKLLVEAASAVSDGPQGILIYIGDGFPTVGEIDIEAIKEKIKKLPNPVRMYAIAPGDESNLDLLWGLCNGRGFATRINDITEAAEAATLVLKDASIPVFENVTFEIDGGIERTYPSEYPLLKITEPLTIIGRLTKENNPQKITIRGTIGGKKFEKSYRIKIKSINDFNDLRMRWAGMRLQSLLDQQEGPESLIELGTRFGIITPYTSFYVPPEEESTNLPESTPFRIFNFSDVETSRIEKNSKVLEVAKSITSVLIPAGCSLKRSIEEERATPTQPQAESSSSQQKIPLSKFEYPQLEMDKNSQLQEGSGTTVRGGYENYPPSVVKSKKAGKVSKKTEGEMEYDFPLGEEMLEQSKGEEKYAEAKTPAPSEEKGLIAEGAMTKDKQKISVPESQPIDESSESYSRIKIYIEAETRDCGLKINEKVRRCTEAALQPVEEKITLWKERLGNQPTLSRIKTVFNEARKNCEIKTENHRRVFARLVLTVISSTAERCKFYQFMKIYPLSASYVRTKIIASLRTPADVQAAMQYCDGAIFISPEEVEKILSKEMTYDGKIIALKKLITLYPNDLSIKLRLLEILELAGRKNEALRLAETLRHDPYANTTIRTRIGDFYVRAGEPQEAKRVFSEIVEFSPWSYETRKKLGELYQAYGWHEDAYRQFETLSLLAPGDESVLVLLAKSALFAGRIDEGLRILHQVSQTEPFSEGKVTPAEIARLLSSIQLALMRSEAKKSGNRDKLKQLTQKATETGIMRDAAGVKIILSKNHPDALLKLSVKLPGSEMSAAPRSSPELGLEWLSDRNKPDGDIVIQVNRDNESPLLISKGTLFVIFDEGKDSETITKIQVDMTKKQQETAAWSISIDGTIKQVESSKSDILKIGY